MRKLDDWLKGYLRYTAYSEAPDLFNFWAGVGAIAGALRRKVWIDQEYLLWTPNFYIIFVAPPGISTKSTAMHQSAKLLHEIAGVQFGASSLTWQALTDDLERATLGVPMGDGTIHTMACLTFTSSEFGSLLDPQDRRMLDTLVDFWDGQDRNWERHTKTSGSNSIVNPWLNIMACTTPSWLADNLPRQMIGGGFTSRCVFVYADYKKQLVPYPKGVIPLEVKQTKPDLIHDLECISVMKGEYSIAPEALELGERWYSEHHETPPEELAGNSQFGGYLSRKQGHVHKLAMVLSASRGDSMVISLDDLQQAIRILSDTERNLPLVFRSINTSQTMEKAGQMIQVLAVHGTMLKRQLYSKFYHSVTYKEFDEAITSIIQAGQATMTQQGNEIVLTYSGNGNGAHRSNGALARYLPGFSAKKAGGV